MKKIKLNITREEDNLQTNIYYVCEKNILISQLNLTINYEENNMDEEEIVEHSNETVNNHTKNRTTKKNKWFNIKISYSDELNNLYLNNVINNLYDYIFECKGNNFNIHKNDHWQIFINIYIYEYTPFIYDHICNVINVHLSLLLIPFCFYDFDEKWYRCVQNYEELGRLLSAGSSLYDPAEKRAEDSTDIVILGGNEQNKKIIINQLENNNFDLFVEKKKGETAEGLFKRVLIKYIPILRTVNVDDQIVYVIKFVEYEDFFLRTQKIDDNIYNNIFDKHSFCNFTKKTSFDRLPCENEADKFNPHENYYILFNANTATVDESSILENSRETIQFYYDFIVNYCTSYFAAHFVK
ncbi:conserved Plasmodium protein, unknown function [Plasmodium knowlesi strain H]|uniref:Uncharacterized protein n=3 Tax=Plasmodium knowlesi TaxID=5850 RepID=A0A5K1TWG5_PLAKH|nr:conserved Plasmodium protein, unknown function [Plasmodium knowlesi strain H]OTN64619.1 Uncharacterized protein PKNOH_S130190100 [Plasmodium knowlesi]CAA9989064.1 conserved Plasmodium protein, unknown function [Plasmodium knowlesi strain H]SBO27276.1 conserved Plasmodium protein, unknown function [Plasmodium knowlesi strain H]SBO28904.1 conserved Plasmodium protein, unknown function [Plasmodium knowlesi strain H]VVS78538.1 conserved Plasmodium protein, unknown function [Plasmodium knowlesi |eukprot:XP_002261413.1 hypothetical protein, conserved in Plasmodium species [Plasmodium knowlesi strain H]